MSKFVKGLLLLSGAAVMTAGLTSPAAAQERRRDRNQQQQPAAPAAPTASRAFAAAFNPANDAVNASNFDAADAALPAVRAAAQSAYEQFLAARLDYQIASGRNDAARQLTAVSAMADSNGAPADTAASVHLAAGQLSYNARDYATAIRRFERAAELGHPSPNLQSLILDSMFRSNQFDAGMARLRQVVQAERTAGRVPSEQLYSSAARPLQEADRNDDLMWVLVERLRDHPSVFNRRTVGLILLRTQPDSRALTLDTMRALMASNALNERRHFSEYASSAAEDGLPGEAVTAVNGARSGNFATSSDGFFNEIFASQNVKVAEDRASLAGTARRAQQVPEARLATLTGDAYMSYGQFSEAAAMYRLALTKTGGDANLLNLRLGSALYRLNDFDGARTALNAVTGPRAALAVIWLSLMVPAAPAATPAPAAPATPAG